MWDNSAQRQLLRALFLPADQAQNWTMQERSILALDSEYRNLRAVVYREERKLAKSEVATQRAGGLHSEWESLTSLQETDQTRNAELLRDFYELDKIRQEARRSMMIAEEEYEVTLRAYERAKLIVLQARFPDQTETARYILGYLITTGECLVCGQNVPDVAEMLNGRITNKQCVVCSSDLTIGSYPIDTSLDYHRAEKAERDLQEIFEFLSLKKHEFNDAEANYKEVAGDLSELNRNMEQRRQRIETIFSLLPKKDIDLQRQHDEFILLRGRLEQLKHDLEGQIKTFGNSLADWKRQIVANATEIQHVCNEYAQQFLTETCSLSWVPYLSMLGQTGARIEFPAFAIEMTGTDFPSAVRRDGPDKVSESQREFIDLAFRMALMQVAGIGSTSLVIDAPESSLDAVFVRKAAEVLNDFSKPDRDNRLLITSNLVDGSLIPSLIKQFSSGELADRIINLFDLATPTAAVKKFAEEYREHYEKILGSTALNEPSV